MSRARAQVRHLAGRVLGERRIPVGAVARDRRLFRGLLTGLTGSVLVVGPGLAVRQALPGVPVDVAGTNPHTRELTVCSTALGEGTLPAQRWDTVVVTSSGGDLAARLAAVVPACRRRLVVLDGRDQRLSAAEIARLAALGTVRPVAAGQAWIAEVRR